MVDENANQNEASETKNFPFITALLALATLFVFVGLMVVAYRSPNYLDEKKETAEPKADPAAKLAEIRAKNEAALNGAGAKMPAAAATAELLDRAKKDGKLPFPVAPPPQPGVPEPKKTK